MKLWNELQEKSYSRLNIGAGEKWVKGDTNLDIRDLPGIDIVCDVSEDTWPLDDEMFKVVTALDVLEHLPPGYNSHGQDRLIFVMEEIHRVLKMDGYALLKFPVPGGSHDYADPTHYRRIVPDTFCHFCPDHGRYGKSITTTARFKMLGFNQLNHNFKVILQVV